MKFYRKRKELDVLVLLQEYITITFNHNFLLPKHPMQKRVLSFSTLTILCPIFYQSKIHKKEDFFVPTLTVLSFNHKILIY